MKLIKTLHRGGDLQPSVVLVFGDRTCTAGQASWECYGEVSLSLW